MPGSAISLARTSLDRFMPSESPELHFRNDSHSPELRILSPKDNSDPFMSLLFSGWNPDLPDPPVLNHLYVFPSNCFCGKTDIFV